MMRDIKIWLSDSRVGNNSVVDHIIRRPVLSPLMSCLTRLGVKMQGMEEWRWMLKDISIQTVYAIHRPIWMGSDEGCG